MTIVSSAFKIVENVTNILDRENERKYKEQFLKLRREMEAEEMKNEPDDLKLHLLRADLELLLSAFADELAVRNSTRTS